MWTRWIKREQPVYVDYWVLSLCYTNREWYKFENLVLNDLKLAYVCYILNFDSPNKMTLSYVLEIRQRVIVFKKPALLFTKLRYWQNICQQNFSVKSQKFVTFTIWNVLRTFFFFLWFFFFFVSFFLWKYRLNKTILAEIGQRSKYVSELWNQLNLFRKCS